VALPVPASRSAGDELERLCEREDGPECAASPLSRATVTEDLLLRGETASVRELLGDLRTLEEVVPVVAMVGAKQHQCLCGRLSGTSFVEREACEPDRVLEWELGRLLDGSMSKEQNCEFVTSDTDRGAGAEGVAGVVAGP
jgi:hypothetical protein